MLRSQLTTRAYLHVKQLNIRCFRNGDEVHQQALLETVNALVTCQTIAGVPRP